MPTKQHPALLDALTKRELEILAILEEGLSNAEIASRLFLSPQTVKWYTRQIYSKLGVTTRTQAIARGQALGLLDVAAPNASPPASVPANHNLPRAPSAFVGRKNEIAYITGLLADANCRLITLVGPGGIGKTRLAVEVAERTEFAFADGVSFVHLQPVETVDQVIHTVGSAVGLTFDGSHAARVQLLNALRDKSALLILDNFEHLLDSADLITEMLAAAPHLKLIVTSRERLNLREEWLVPVEGLACPDDHQSGNLDAYSAVQLFVAGVRRVRPDFTWQGHEAEIVNLCQLVRGMPLALELAATWIRALSLSEIIAQISLSIDFLSSPWRDMPARHQSMRAVFDGSWQLLSDNQQNVFRCLAVFQGGFSIEAAMAVAAASFADMAALIDKSLVQPGKSGRYELHELLRQYAAEKLDETPELRDEALDRHCDYYTHCLHHREATIHLSDHTDLLEDMENARAAWLRAVQQRNRSALERAAPTLHWLFHFQARHDEGAEYFYRAEAAFQDASNTDDGRYILAVMPLIRAFFRPERASGEQPPPVDVEAALALWDTLEERPEMGLALSRAMLGLANRGGKLSQVVALARKSLEFSRRHHDRSGEAIALATLGAITLEAYGDLGEAERLFEEALRIDRQIGFHLNARWAESVLGIIARLRGQYEQARAHCEASVEHHRIGNIARLLDDHLLDLGEAELELDNNVQATAHFAEGMAIANKLERHALVARGLAGYGLVAAYAGDSTTAAAYYRQSQDHLEAHGTDAIAIDANLTSLDLLALLLGDFDRARARYEADEARFNTERARSSLMTCRCRLGHALIGLGEQERARRYLFGALHDASAYGAFSVLLEAMAGIAQLPLLPPSTAIAVMAFIRGHPAANRYSRTLTGRCLPLIEVSLSSDEFAAAVAHGCTLTIEAAVALIEALGFDVDADQRVANEQLVEPLSARELEILILVAAGLTNREIADQMVVGVSTVKKHINHIYSKLDVADRSAVIRRARALRLIS